MVENRTSSEISLLSMKVSEQLLSNPEPVERFPSDLKHFKIQKELIHRLSQLNTWRLELEVKYPELLSEIDQLISTYSALLKLKSFNIGSTQLLRNTSNTMLCLKRPKFPLENYQIVEHTRFSLDSHNLSLLANIHSIYIDSFNSVVTDIKLLKDNSTIIISSFDKTIRIWNIINGKQLKILDGHRGYIEKLEITTDERYLLSASHDKSVFIWDLQVYEKVFELKWHQKTVFDVVLTNDQQFVASGDEGGSVIVGCWGKYVEKLNSKCEADIELHCRFEHGLKVRCLISSQDGKTIFSAGLDNCIKIWDLQTKDIKSVLSGHKSIILDMKILNTSNYLLSTGQDCCLIIWDLEKMCMRNNIKTGHSEYINSICISQDETFAILAGRDVFYSIIDINKRNIVNKVEIERGFINAITMKNSDEIILCEDNVVGLSISNSEKTFKIGGNFWARLIILKVSHYDKYLMGYFKDRTVKFWSLDNGEVSFTFSLPADAVSVSYTPNYKYLLYSPNLNMISVLKISFNSE